jgi:hypothetical protein
MTDDLLLDAAVSVYVHRSSPVQSSPVQCSSRRPAEKNTDLLSRLLSQDPSVPKIETVFSLTLQYSSDPMQSIPIQCSLISVQSIPPAEGEKHRDNLISTPEAGSAGKLKIDKCNEMTVTISLSFDAAVPIQFSSSPAPVHSIGPKTHRHRHILFLRLR